MSKTLLAQVGDVLVGDKRFGRKHIGGLFVVIATAFTGGSHGRDSFPDGHKVTCKKLDSNGVYDPNGTQFEFYQSGCFANMIPNPTFAQQKMSLAFLTQEAEASTARIAGAVPNRQTILERIDDYIGVVAQWSSLTNYARAAEYESKATALVEL